MKDSASVLLLHTYAVLYIMLFTVPIHKYVLSAIFYLKFEVLILSRMYLEVFSKEELQIKHFKIIIATWLIR